MNLPAQIANDVVTPLRPEEFGVHSVLLVDDDRVLRMMASAQLTTAGYRVEECVNGEEALTLLMQYPERFDAVLLDREMPVMDGITLALRMKKHAQLKHIPIIMLTGYNHPEQVKEGIEAGVFYYLAKPLQMTVLKPILDSAVKESVRTRTLHREIRMHRSSFSHMLQSQFEFRTLEDAESLACFLAYCFPDPDRVIHGLYALFINAVEHGIADIGYAHKTQLLDQQRWAEEVALRLALPEHVEQKALATFRRREEGCYITITDPGNGFDWREYINYSPSRAQAKHGRGIAQAMAVSFDNLTFNERGNEAIGFVAAQSTLEW